jgi:hypothetical protein
MLEDSSTVLPFSSAYLTSLFDLTGVGVSWAEFDAGRRKGNTPDGEAWLLEESRR